MSDNVRGLLLPDCSKKFNPGLLRKVKVQGDWQGMKFSVKLVDNSTLGGFNSVNLQ